MSRDDRNTNGHDRFYAKDEPVEKVEGFEKYLKAWYGILGILGAVLITGWASHGWLSDLVGGKADAASVATDHAKIETLSIDQHTLQVEYTHLHEDVVGLRQDVRDGFAGRALPVITPEAPLVVATPMVTHP